MKRMYEREAAILKHLDGRYNPKLIEVGTFSNRTYLTLEWCSGVNVGVAANNFRLQKSNEGRKKLLRLCCKILEAYSHLHAQNVIHSDIHPKNILISDNGTIKIIDYGLSRHETVDQKIGKPERGGIGYFFEPEFAMARLAGCKPPPSSILGEQYALAALLYFLLTGTHTQNFSLEKMKMDCQIAENNPISFDKQKVEPWPEVEGILTKALSKNHEERF
ncbi:protein kinase family protein [Neobacillus ginsengisoli]|uniref:Serine/threonine protein kinase n=1 Tax=Neobacillus ginsengisoli TaxID=904295 RepID=A0ABT9Y2B2_9BACI|nr:protein kinase family protein [Neobacillus ginsengisoli]MDQ0201955.1 serine/threonine protein kinase [Neobacillus ginsengisoli]